MIVDAHVHADERWSEPVEVLNFEMDTNGVSHAVIVQLNGHYDNTYLLECVKRFEGRFKAVCALDTRADDRIQVLRTLKKQGGSGFRVNIRTERDWGPDNSLFRAAGDCGMIVDVIGTAANFASARFKKLLDDCPDTHFCLEHLARNPGSDLIVLGRLPKLPERDALQAAMIRANLLDAPPYDTYKQGLECADWPNTSIKVPGLGSILVRPDVMPEKLPWEIPPHYQMAKDAFGAKRMMWGSNFPPVGCLEGYRNALQWVRDLPAFKDGDDADWVMGKTAAKIWGFAA